eukprot:SAG22_NODE_8822_length_627_cov_1.687500_2_plen_41_part_01
MYDTVYARRMEAAGHLQRVNERQAGRRAARRDLASPAGRPA